MNLYRLDYHDRSGSEREYFFASRNPEDSLKIKTHELTPEGVCVYAITEEKQPRLVVIREYRFPLDEEIYSLPCGLIDEGETAGVAAARELLEETGYEFSEYTGGEAFMRRPFFLAPGFSDEPGSAVFGTVQLTEKPRPENEASEWISVILADKEEVRRILNEEKVSVRAAFLMMNYLRSSEEAPFAFLEA